MTNIERQLARIHPRSRCQVWGGGHFDWKNPRAEDVSIRTICTVMARTPRYRGHCRAWYSVADHVTHVVQAGPPEYGRELFLHDAHEVYSPFGDVRRPDKAEFPFIDEIEYAIDLAICERFGLSIERLRSDVVREADDRVLATEYRDVRWPDEDDRLDDLPDPLPYRIIPKPLGLSHHTMLRPLAIELGLWDEED